MMTAHLFSEMSYYYVILSLAQQNVFFRQKNKKYLTNLYFLFFTFFSMIYCISYFIINFFTSCINSINIFSTKATKWFFT